MKLLGQFDLSDVETTVRTCKAIMRRGPKRRPNPRRSKTVGSRSVSERSTDHSNVAARSRTEPADWGSAMGSTRRLEGKDGNAMWILAAVAPGPHWQAVIAEDRLHSLT